MFRLAALTLLCLPVSALAGPTEVIQAVEKRYANVDSISGSFTQTTKSELYAAVPQTGSMVLQRPSKMRWDFSDGKQYLTDGATMWITNPEDKQVLQMDDVAASSASADSILQSLDKVSELFEVQVLEDTATAKTLKLLPKGGSEMLKEVVLSLDGDLVLQRVGILDAFGSQTDLAFTEVKLGAAVDAATFTFTAPEGFEVVKN